jgi:hypothetical protein
VLLVLVVGGLTFAGTLDECNCQLHPESCGGRGGGGGGGGGGLHVCGGTAAGCISTGPIGPSSTVHKGFSAQRYHGDGTYGLRQTITGHVAYSNGTTRMFDTLYSYSEIQEWCLPQTEVDASSFGPPLVSPRTTYTEGGYATGMFDCPLGGQALYWQWSWNWENASPYVAPENHTEVACTKIKPPLRGWGEDMGWCDDD